MTPYFVAGRRVGRDLWVHEIVHAANGQMVVGTISYSGSPVGAQAASQMADLLNAVHAVGYAAGTSDIARIAAKCETDITDIVRTIDEVIK